MASDVERRTVGLERVDASYAGDIVNCAKVAVTASGTDEDKDERRLRDTSRRNAWP